MELHEALYTTRAMRRVQKDPIPLDVQARILDAAIRAPSGGNQQNWRFLLLDDPAKKAALAPLYQHAMGELWKSVYKAQLDAAAADPDAPESIQMLKVQRSAQWLADHFEDVPLYLFPFSQYDPTGGSIYPAVWSAMLAARAEGVGSCLTALLQFFHPGRDVRDPRRARPTRAGSSRARSASATRPAPGASAAAAAGPRRLLPQHLGHRRRLRGARSPMAGADASSPLARSPARCCAWRVAPGDEVPAGAVLVVIESMKMEHVIEAPTPGRIDSFAVARRGRRAERRRPPACARRRDELGGTGADAAPRRSRRTRPTRPPGAGRAARPHGRARWTPGRPEATERRHARGRRTARENIEDLCDPGSFEEYGRFVIAAQRARRSTDDLIANTPADGLIAGLGRVNGDLFAPEQARCAVLSYDYSVLAGTQGQMNHKKKDRLFELVERLGLPVVLFAEGGGGRPGDTDTATVTGLDTAAFALFGALSGRVPLVGHRLGPLLRRQRRAARVLPRHHRHARRQHRDGWPGHDRGRRPGRVRPRGRRARLGAGAERRDRRPVRRREGRRSRWPAATSPTSRATCREWSRAGPDAAARRRAARPAPRLRRAPSRSSCWPTTARCSSCDPPSRPGMVTALARVEGRAVGVIANNPMHLAGAIDGPAPTRRPASCSCARRSGCPCCSLCDTPGFMVGPEAEETALVRHVSRMFVVGASLTVPFCCVILRKGYGLGAQAMAGGSFHRPVFTVAWPTGELGGMGLEGAVRLGLPARARAPSRTTAEREAAFDGDGGAGLRARQGAARGRVLRDRRRHRPGGHPGARRPRARVGGRAARSRTVRGGRRRPFVDTWYGARRPDDRGRVEIERLLGV